MSDAWEIRTWARSHAKHGSFFISMLPDGRASAMRVYDPARLVEDLFPLAPAANAAIAMMRCEDRIAELDAQLELPLELELERVA